MSTVRFSKVIEACGKPDFHLLLIDPAKDKTLQTAIKSDRVMTVYQQSGETDHGIVGFEQGRSRQFLVFPKPLKAFQGQRIVGIKYELLEDAPTPKPEPAKKEPAKPAAEQPQEPASAKEGSEPSKRPDPQTPTVLPKVVATKPKEADRVDEKAQDRGNSGADSQDKVVQFQKPEPAEQLAAASERDDIKALKRRVREAMDALEEGKQVVAFNLLKRILENDPS
jgi:outer membrane biosynthesis protein TonB